MTRSFSISGAVLAVGFLVFTGESVVSRFLWASYLGPGCQEEMCLLAFLAQEFHLGNNSPCFPDFRLCHKLSKMMSHRFGSCQQNHEIVFLPDSLGWLTSLEKSFIGVGWIKGELVV